MYSAQQILYQHSADIVLKLLSFALPTTLNTSTYDKHYATVSHTLITYKSGQHSRVTVNCYSDAIDSFCNVNHSWAFSRKQLYC